MGLDINIATDADDALYDADYFASDEHHKHTLSRTFCNFINRRNVISTEPELDQLGRLTDTDITSLYEMEEYPNPESIEFQIMTAESDDEKEAIHVEAEKSKERIKGNLDKVLLVVDKLIARLSEIDNLQTKITASDLDALGTDEYFSDFRNDRGDGYVDNNFGHDLRNFQRFLRFAKTKGAKTVYFVYG